MEQIQNKPFFVLEKEDIFEFIYSIFNKGNNRDFLLTFNV